MEYSTEIIEFWFSKQQETKRLLRDLSEACSALEHYGVIRLGCDIDRGSRWAPTNRFSDLFNKVLDALKAAKES